MTTPAFDAPDDLRSTAALRRLAHGLLFDRASADDVVQEAWLTVTRQAPPRGVALGAWLAGCVRRTARGLNRAAGRRRRLEQSVARSEVQADVTDGAERLEVLRKLVEAVQALDEPYRRTLLLRFFDDLGPGEIARREGVPLETVRSRVRRGLARLRIVLDPGGDPCAGADGEQDRARFLAGLLPLASASTRSAPLPPWSGLFASSAKTAGAVAFVAVSLALVAHFVLRERPSLPPSSGNEGTPPLAFDTDERALDTASLTNAGDAATATQRSALRNAAAEATWIVGGRLTLGLCEAFPAAPVQVELLATSADGLGGERLAVARTTSDANGRFSCKLPRPTRASIVVATPTGVELFVVPARVRVDPSSAAPTSLEPLAFPIDAWLVGRVVDERGTPVAGARIATFHQEGHTAQDGSFRVPASSHVLLLHGTVLANGFEDEPFWLPPRAGTIDAGTLTLTPARTLSGRVVDLAGAPLAGVRVGSTWAVPGHASSRSEAFTDDAGHFELDGLRSNPSRANPSFGEPVQVCFEQAGYARAREEVVQRADGSFEDLQVTLSRGSSVSGTVRAPDGSPAAAIEVVAADGPRVEPRTVTWTDAQGAFTLEHVPPGPRTLWALRPGANVARAAIVVPPEGGRLAGLELAFARGPALTGRVLDEADEPVAGLFVLLGPFQDASQWVDPVRTDANGRFGFEDLPDPPFSLTLFGSGTTRLETRIESLDGTERVLRVQSAASLAGTVLDGTTGSPLPAFTLRARIAVPTIADVMDTVAQRWSSPGLPFVDPNGTFRVQGMDLRPGTTLTVEVSAPGYGTHQTTRRAELAPDPAAFVLTLFPAATVRGTVRDADDGRPLAGLRVTRAGPDPLAPAFVHVSTRAGEAAPSLDPTRDVEPPVLTDSDGRFTLHDVAPGPLQLALGDEFGTLAQDGPFNVPAGATLERHIAVRRPAPLTGRATDPDGRAVAGASIRIEAESESHHGARGRRTTTDAEGRFRLEHVPAGTYRLTWAEQRGSAYIPLLARTIVVEDDAPAFDLAFDGDTQLAGSVPVDAGETFALVRAERIDAAGQPTPDARAYAVLTTDGRFAWRGLVPGRYRLSARGHRSDDGAVAEVELAPGASVEVRLERP